MGGIGFGEGKKLFSPVTPEAMILLNKYLYKHMVILACMFIVQRINILFAFCDWRRLISSLDIHLDSWGHTKYEVFNEMLLSSVEEFDLLIWHVEKIPFPCIPNNFTISIAKKKSGFRKSKMKRNENYTLPFHHHHKYDCCAPECEIKRGTKLNICKAGRREAEQKCY